MILESGMNLFDDFNFNLNALNTTETKISNEIDFGSPEPFKKGGSKATLLAYCLEDTIESTGTNVGISFYIQSKAEGGEYGPSINVANILLADIVPGEPIINMILPKTTKQIVSLKAKLTGTTPAITTGKFFANIQPYIG